LCGREDIPETRSSETMAAIQDLITNFESKWREIKQENDYDNLSPQEQKRLEEDENSRRAMWMGHKYTPLPADGNNLQNYIDLELAGYTIPLKLVIDRVRETIKELLEDNLLHNLPYMQNYNWRDYIVAGVSGDLYGRFKSYFSRKDGRGDQNYFNVM